MLTKAPFLLPIKSTTVVPTEAPREGSYEAPYQALKIGPPMLSMQPITAVRTEAPMAAPTEGSLCFPLNPSLQCPMHYHHYSPLK